MSRALGLGVFLSIACGMLFGIHYYLWARLVRDTALPVPWRQVATGALVALGVSMPVTLITFRLLHRSAARALAWPAYVWMGLMAFLFLIVLGTDVLRLLAFLARGGAPIDPEKRLFLRRLVGAAAAALAGATGLYSMNEALRHLRLKEVEVPLARLPRALDGLTIVQLTDVHVGPTIGRAFIEELVERVSALRPDVVAITGDLVDGSVEQLREAVAPLARLKAKHGVYFVTGNHEYYSGVDEWCEELGRLGVRVLRNERVSIGAGPGSPDPDASFDLAGIDDHSSRGLAPGHGPDLPRALAGRDAARELVLLAHQPRAIREAARHGVGLQLSGHTHGGQMFPWNLLVRLQQPFVAGLDRYEGTQIYVSRGTGYWGPPMRLGAPSEITRVVLRSRA